MTDATVADDDLTPREPRPGRTRSRRWIPAIVAIAVVAAIVVLVWNLFTGTLFFYNADEAVERRAELGDDRFTLQGTPIGCTITDGFRGAEPVVAFSVSFGGVAVDVVHVGEPAELFEGGTPVVLDGQWVEGAAPVEGFSGLAGDGFHYASDRMRVKHDEDYINDDEYDARLEASSAQSAESPDACGR